MSDVLRQRISSDLNVSQFECETEEDYGNRLVYSALVAWARVLVLGSSYTDISTENDTLNDYHNVDIMQIQTRLHQVAYGMLSAIKHRNEWIKNYDIETASNELARSIIKQLKFCYELSKLGKRRLIISPQKTAVFHNNQLALGGTGWENFYSVGVGRWLSTISPLVDYKDVFGIPACSCIQYYNMLKSNANWMENELNSTYQIFNIGTTGWYSKAWIEFNKSKIPKGVSLLKNMETDGGYFLIKNDADGILSAKLDKWYYDEKEIYRFLYSLNAVNKTPAIFKAKTNYDHILLHCNSSLPNAEMRILCMSSWPFNTYDDIFKRIIPKFLWCDIEKCLNDLGIVVKFENSI